MLRSWTILGLLALFIAGAALLSPDGPTGPRTVSAEHAEEITIDVSGPAGVDLDFAISGASCTPTSINNLDDDDGAVELTCDAGAADITVTLPTGYELNAIACSVEEEGTTANEQSDVDDESFADNDVEVNITDNEHVACLFTFSSVATPTTTATATATVVATPQVGSITGSATPNSIGCSGSAFITFIVRNAGGQPVGGAAVQVSASIGSVSPTSATSLASDGGVLVVFTAPANQGGTATITATSGGVSGSTQVAVNCAQATATSVPPTAVPPTAVPPVVQPPATGDAGLAESSNGSMIAGLALLGAALSGAAAFAWSRIRA
jgi:hypothetical protein